MKRYLSTLAALVASAQVALSQTPYETPVTARVLPGWVQQDGTRVAALHLSLLPGWKTYWRAPGDAGIPPQFDWSASRNLGAVSVTWPTPIVFNENGMRSIGYKNELIIPLAIAPRKNGKPVRLKGDMDLGICADICMPHTLSFDMVLDTTVSTPTPAIAAALAERPFSAREAGVTSSTCRIMPIEDGMQIEARVAMPSAGGREEAVIEPGLPGVWVSEPITRREGGQIVAVSEMVHVNGNLFAVDRSAIRITVLGSAHAVDIRGCQPG